MSLAHVILGLLQQEERTGYDLKTNCFNCEIAHWWQADQAQIYRTLDKLEAQGWIACTFEIQQNRPNRKVYSVTESGQAEFARWLQCPQPLPVMRDPLLAQLYFAALLPNDAAIAPLKQQLEARRDKLATCQAIVPVATSSHAQKMQRLVQDCVISQEQAYVNWLEAAIEEVRQPT